MRIDAVVARLLAALVRDAGQLVTKATLIERVWQGRAVSDNVITVAMVRLRKTLGHVPGEREFIVNHHGRGYRFVRLVTDRASDAPVGTVAPTALAPPFVGREATMGPLRAALASARAGRGSVCLLIGEAGIGKTRTAEWLAGEASEAGAQVAWGHCQEACDAPSLWPIAQLVRDLVAARRESPEHLAPPLAWLLAELGGQPKVSGVAKPAAKHLLYEAITSVFRATRTPCVLILDDLHRADAASLELLRYFVDRVARTEVLLVATVRKQPSRLASAADDFAYVLGHRNATRLELERLGEASVAAYVSALLPDAPPSVAQAVWEKSEGNAFFMVELARQLVDADRVDLARLRVPDAALELIRPRVRSLDSAARGVLSQAAVIGRSFELPALQAVSGYDARTLMAFLDDAIASEVVVAASDSVTAFAFGHELIRQMLYDALPGATRRALHRRIGEVLEQEARETGGVPAAVLAYHFHAALPDGPIHEAVRYSADAAQEAANVFAYADSLRHLRHAREALALSASPPREVRLGLLLGHALSARICAAPEFERLTDELAHLAREYRMGAFMAHAGLMRDLHAGFPALPGARQILEEALALLPEDDCEARPAVLARLATAGPIAYDAAASCARATEALALAERGGARHALYCAHDALLYLKGGPAHGADRERAEAALERLCRAHPKTLTAPPVLLAIHRAIRAFQEVRLGDVRAILARAEARCRQLGSRELHWHVLRLQALERMQAGQVRRSAALRSLHRRARADGIVMSELFCTHDEVVVLGDTLEPARLRQVLTPIAADPPNVWSIKVRTLSAAGLHDDARAALHAVPSAALAKLPRDRDYLGTLGALARAALSLSERGYLEPLYALLQPYASHLAVHGSFYCEGPVAALLGDLARALGRPGVAQRHLRAAHALSEQLGLTTYAARAAEAPGTRK